MTPWAIANILLLLLLLGIAGFSTYRRRVVKERMETSAQHEAQQAEEARRSEAAVMLERRGRAQDLDEARRAAAAEAALTAQLESAREETRQALQRADDALRQDHPSQQLLLEAAARCRLDGFLLTNLRALGRGEKGYFQAQVDHVLVTTRGVVAVENKYWRGVVFDGTTPESVHSHWRTSSGCPPSWTNSPSTSPGSQGRPGTATSR